MKTLNLKGFAFRLLMWGIFSGVSLLMVAIVMTVLSPDFSQKIIDFQINATNGWLKLIKFFVYALVVTGLIFWDTSLSVIFRNPDCEKIRKELTKNRSTITVIFSFIMLFDAVLPFISAL